MGNHLIIIITVIILINIVVNNINTDGKYVKYAILTFGYIFNIQWRIDQNGSDQSCSHWPRQEFVVEDGIY